MRTMDGTAAVVVLGACALLGCGADGGASPKSTGGAGGAGGDATGAGGATSSSSTSSSSSGATGSGGSTSSSSSSSTSSTSSSTSGGGATGSGGSAAPGGLFEAPSPWTDPVSQAPADPQSDAIIQWLAAQGGWGTGVMKIDFGIGVLTADASTPYVPFDPTGDFYSPDCDHVPFPVPAGGAIEGEQGYACEGDGDCHLIVVDPLQKKLYEMWRAFAPPSATFYGGCGVVWDLAEDYPANLRGDGCTSADAGGFPIAAMLVTADEVAAQDVGHALRFILPNSRIRDGVYVHPGTHTTGATSGGANAPPYGVRFRLKAGFDLASLPSDGARVVAKAMQKYGMFLADAGQIALTFADDRFTTAKWSDVGIDASSFAGLEVTNFEVVEMGSTYTNVDCVRNP